MRWLLDFQPDDGPLETIEVWDRDDDFPAMAEAAAGADGTLILTGRVSGEKGQPRKMLFRASRISNVREAL